MNVVFHWTGIVVWSAAALTAAVFTVVNIVAFTGRWVTFGPLNRNYAPRLAGRRPGRLCDAVPPVVYARIPWLRFGIVIQTVSDRRWAALWPRIHLADNENGRRVVWPAGRNLVVSAYGRDRTPAARYATLIADTAAAAGATVHTYGGTDTLPTWNIGAQPTVIVVHRSKIVDQTDADTLTTLIGYGCTILYVNDTPFDIEAVDFTTPPLFRFPLGSRVMSVQAGDRWLSSNGTDYSWPEPADD